MKKILPLFALMLFACTSPTLGSGENLVTDEDTGRQAIMNNVGDKTRVTDVESGDFIEVDGNVADTMNDEEYTTLMRDRRASGDGQQSETPNAVRMRGGSLAPPLDTEGGQTALFGSWSAWGQVTLAYGGYTYVYFSPNKPGNHIVEFGNYSNVYHSGTMEACWHRPGTGWNCWAWPNVLSRYQQLSLYTGSADVSYRFKFTANGTSAFNTVVMTWRFYTN